MDWFVRDFDHPAYFEIYADKVAEAAEEGPALSALLGLPAGSLVLDLPCGWGRLHPYLADRGYQVVGGDLSPLNLKRHAAESPSPLARLDFRALPFRTGSADGVFCAFTSWGYFATGAENLRQLEEFARVLHPEGTLLLDLAGRGFLQDVSALIGEGWQHYPEEGYLERVRWSPDGRRIWTERHYEGLHFRHDIWIPTHEEVLTCLSEAGFVVQEVFGGLDGRPWAPKSDRWIYRAIRR